MSDAVLAHEILNQVQGSVERILRRFEPVASMDWFLDSEEGLEKLDSICMQLIAIGESLKNLDKVAGKELLRAYPEIDWKGAKGMRDVITHHYFDLDAEAVYDVCETNLPQMRSVLKRMLLDLESQ